MVITPEQLVKQVKGKSLRSLKHICFECSRDLQPEDAFKLAKQVFLDPDLHGAMAATLIAGHISYLLPEALAFLREKCAQKIEPSIQECLAKAFDHYCLNVTYELALPMLREWAKDANENVRRAAIEAPRNWAKKDYFKAHPDKAIKFLAKFREDESAKVRMSAGQALAEVAEDFPDLVIKELRNWNMKLPNVKHTYMFAAKNLHAKMGVLYT